MSEHLYEVLYLSRLAADTAIGEIAPIVRSARVRNALRGVTGTLVFDGQRFCQLLEGAEDEVRPLMQRIAADPRHVQVNVLFLRMHAGARRFPGWSLGYALAQEPGSLDALHGVAGQSAVDHLHEILPRCELEP